VSRHLDEFVPADPASLVFTGPTGAAIRRGNFNDLVKWSKVVAAIGVPELHFHDLRHTGNTLAAASRVSTRDLMARMGHDSMHAALIYRHATSEADRAIADALEARFSARSEDTDDSDKRGDSGGGESDDAAGQWPVDGPRSGSGPESQDSRFRRCACDLGLYGGAGEGNRTPTVSLGS
jgi:hypothetical protein